MNMLAHLYFLMICTDVTLAICPYLYMSPGEEWEGASKPSRYPPVSS